MGGGGPCSLKEMTKPGLADPLQVDGSDCWSFRLTAKAWGFQRSMSAEARFPTPVRMSSSRQSTLAGRGGGENGRKHSPAAAGSLGDLPVTLFAIP